MLESGRKFRELYRKESEALIKEELERRKTQIKVMIRIKKKPIKLTQFNREMFN